MSSSHAPMASDGDLDPEMVLHELQAAVSEGEQDLQVLAEKLTEAELQLDNARIAVRLADTRLGEAADENVELHTSLAGVESQLTAQRDTISAQAAHIARLKTQLGRPVRLLAKKALRPLGIGKSKS